ncbi:hypothetical protein NSP_52350 [Nodularia spumigena CCY9414]|nr:hypothetical protein NSP_52350 [Nodularia spumigena CCY9414]
MTRNKRNKDLKEFLHLTHSPEEAGAHRSTGARGSEKLL